MPDVPIDRDREHRIDYEVIVDCYHDEEVTLGWYYYLEKWLAFPFDAERCVPGQSQAATVRAIGMADEEECKTDMLVEIEYREGDLVDTFTIPLAELEPLSNEGKRKEALEDWRYWLGQGHSLPDPDEYDDSW